MTATPPSLTSAPIPSPPVHVWRLDFVFTPKDGALAPTAFTVNVPDHQSGELVVGKNVPLQTAVSTTASVPRQDVGLKVKAHISSIPNAVDDFLMDIDLELSSVETGTPASTIRKITARGGGVATPGKSTLLVSLDEDKRHYELTVTPTKLR